MSFINNNWWLVPLIITIFSGILCPAMGTVLITHKRLLQVNLISHCVLPGLALALALGIHPSIGGVISGLLGSVIAESLTNRKSENYEAVMNTILAGMLGFGVLIIPLLGIRIDLEAVLFGDLLTANFGDLLRTIIAFLVFITLIQIACILKIQNLIIFILPICLFWGRFSNLFFIEKFKYMSYKKKSISHKKFWNGLKKESLISIFFLLIFIPYQLVSITSQEILIKFLILILIGLFLSYLIPKMLGNKIGGFNGDACGASVVLVETAMIFMHAILL